MRLIDSDKLIKEAWNRFYKQEDEHEKRENYDILRDRLHEQEGFECFLQTVNDAPTIDTVPKGIWENTHLILAENLKKHMDNLIEQKCSYCGLYSTRIDGHIELNYCPYCGASMKKEGD